MPVILDALWWTVAFYALTRLARGDEPSLRWWLLLALAGGIGLLTKFSILFLGFGVLVALLATPWRRALLTRRPWLVLLIALALGSPSIVGQVNLGWPLVGQMQDLQHHQLQHVTVAGFFLTQLMFGPAMFVGAAGALLLLLAPGLRPYRLIGWVLFVVWATLVILHGKAYYVGATYPVLFAAGGVALQRLRAPRLGPVVRWAAVGLTAAYGVLVLPLGLPILRPGPTERYIRAIGAVQALRDNQGVLLPLPQDYADMLGWEERVAAVAAAYRSLPRARARAGGPHRQQLRRGGSARVLRAEARPAAGGERGRVVLLLRAGRAAGRRRRHPRREPRGPAALVRLGRGGAAPRQSADRARGAGPHGLRLPRAQERPLQAIWPGEKGALLKGEA